ncbi:DUF2938 family protein [Sulfitobacter mediterraneus]|uniref:DUF2938 family protein n=1 Tax=Sulfitobacter mediterraneus TaxID=83219 RepID=A0A061SUN2_9RHOB|nr:DUF2938 family protein [Sulfitobacter mediterraneus]KAJ03189.1 hypothetical protein PM02_09855 [Sulfitobacter mediterraneus]
MIGVWMAAEMIMVGVVATAVMDVIAELRARLTGVRGLDYALLGRWVLHMRNGRWFHDTIGGAAKQTGERVLGWALHYLIGVIWAVPVVLLVQSGANAGAAALLVGVGSVVAPWLIMQPAFGMGVAGRRLPHPWVARSRSLQTHLSFALGLWLAVLGQMALFSD